MVRSSLTSCFVPDRREGCVLWASIVGLLYVRCPAAVAGLIVFVVVDPIDSPPPTRMWSHVVSKDCKRFPPLAHCDPASAPVSVVGVSAAVAAAPHLDPGTIQRVISRAPVRAKLGYALFVGVWVGPHTPIDHEPNRRLRRAVLRRQRPLSNSPSSITPTDFLCFLE